MWGLFNTIRLNIFGTVLAIILGTVMGICRSSKVVFLRLVSGTYVETMRNLPPLAGQFVSLIKDSSIVSVISILELSFRANELMTGTLLTMEIWITVAILYLILTLPCSVAIQKLENQMARGLS